MAYSIYCLAYHKWKRAVSQFSPALWLVPLSSPLPSGLPLPTERGVLEGGRETGGGGGGGGGGGRTI